VNGLLAFSDGTQITVGGVGFTSGKLGDTLRVSWSKDVGNAGMRGWLFNVGGRYLF
jgi:hypothetical protein